MRSPNHYHPIIGGYFSYTKVLISPGRTGGLFGFKPPNTPPLFSIGGDLMLIGLTQKSGKGAFNGAFLGSWQSPSYSRRRSKLCVIPNQFSNWCGNLPRHRDRTPNYVSFRTSPQTGVGISLVIETAFLLKMEIATPVCELARNDLN